MKTQNSKSVKRLHLIYLISFFIILIWSAIKPVQIGTWFLEVTPVALGAFIVIFYYNKFRLTTPVYLLILIGIITVLIGGHYTYGKVPFFSWLNEQFQLGRNYYDRFGHFISGFVYSLTLREILLRKSPLQKGKLLIAIILGLALGVSALYEISEWLVAMLMGSGAEAFLGIQGDIWDTQWDMFLEFTGAMVCLLTLSSTHNRYLTKEIRFKK